MAANDGVSTTNNILDALGSDFSSGTTGNKLEKKVAGKEEFLTLLVTQLQHQDPLNPMENQEFAVQLAQFSALEQLIEINGKINTPGGGDSSSLAGYLGNVVTLNTDNVSVDNHDGGFLRVDLARGTNSVTVELLDEQGTVVESFDAGALDAGRHNIALSDLGVRSGEYLYRITAEGRDGSPFDVSGKVAGLVSGFIPGATPALLVGNKEVALSDVTEVSLAPKP